MSQISFHKLLQALPKHQNCCRLTQQTLLCWKNTLEANKSSNCSFEFSYPPGFVINKLKFTFFSQRFPTLRVIKYNLLDGHKIGSNPRVFGKERLYLKTRVSLLKSSIFLNLIFIWWFLFLAMFFCEGSSFYKLSTSHL